MASAACAISSEKFLDCSPSFGLRYDTPATAIGKKPRSPPPPALPEAKDIEVSRNDMGDFEFRLVDDPVAMLPADELFSGGKLLPLRFGSSSSSLDLVEAAPTTGIGIGSVSAAAVDRGFESSSDLYVLSPKAPRCSSRLIEILGLKKAQSCSTNTNNSSKDAVVLQKNHRCLMKYFLHRNHKSSSSDHLPLLKEETDSREFVSSSSSSARLSLSSSSSSGFDHEDLPGRLSLDSDRLGKIHTRPKTNPNPNTASRRRRGERNSCSTTTEHMHNNRIGRSPTRRGADETECSRIRAFSVDSPRMNSSGKVVFHNLGRSSSSPSSFNGGQQTKMKPRGMERSYSSNVMVTPVLNVPVCSLRGSSKFGFFPTSSSTSSSSSTQRKSSDGHHHSASSSLRDQMKRNRTDRVC